MSLFKRSGPAGAYAFVAAILFFSCPAELGANQAAQIPKIMGRGLVNVATSPLEVFRTPLVESGQHPYLWPLSFGPRAIRNFTYRLTSGLYDFGFYPVATPFLEETPPLTDKMGISDYIWKNEDTY